MQKPPEVAPSLPLAPTFVTERSVSGRHMSVEAKALARQHFEIPYFLFIVIVIVATFLFSLFGMTALHTVADALNGPLGDRLERLIERPAFGYVVFPALAFVAGVVIHRLHAYRPRLRTVELPGPCPQCAYHVAPPDLLPDFPATPRSTGSLAYETVSCPECNCRLITFRPADNHQHASDQPPPTRTSSDPA